MIATITRYWEKIGNGNARILKSSEPKFQWCCAEADENYSQFCVARTAGIPKGGNGIVLANLPFIAVNFCPFCGTRARVVVEEAE